MFKNNFKNTTTAPLRTRENTSKDGAPKCRCRINQLAFVVTTNDVREMKTPVKICNKQVKNILLESKKKNKICDLVDVEPETQQVVYFDGLVVIHFKVVDESIVWQWNDKYFPKTTC